MKPERSKMMISAASSSRRSRAAAEAPPGGELRLLVDVDLADLHAARSFLCDLLDDGREHAARAAPACPEIDEDGQLRLHDLRVKIVFCNG